MRRKYIKYYNKLRLFLNVPLQYVKCSSIPSFLHLWPWRTDLCVALQLTDDPRHRTIRKGYRYNVLFYLFFLFTCLNFFYLLFFLNERLPPLPRVRIGWDVTLGKKARTQCRPKNVLESGHLWLQTSCRVIHIQYRVMPKSVKIWICHVGFGGGNFLWTICFVSRQ